VIDDHDRSAAARAARIAATLLPPAPTTRRRGAGAAADADGATAASEDDPLTPSERAAWTAAEALSARVRGVPAALKAVADDVGADHKQKQQQQQQDPQHLALLAASRLAAALARLPPAAGAFAGLGGAPSLPLGAGAAAAAEEDDEDDDRLTESEREMRAEFRRQRGVGSTAGARRTAEAFRALAAALLQSLAALLPLALNDSAAEEEEEEEGELEEQQHQQQRVVVMDMTPGPEPRDPAAAEAARSRRRAAARREARRRLAADALLACATYGATVSSPASLFWRALPSADEAGVVGQQAGAPVDEDASEQEEEEDAGVAAAGGSRDSNDDDEGQALSRRVFKRAAGLFTPWSDAACAEASAAVLQVLAEAAQAAADRAVGGGSGENGRSQPGPSPPPGQLLLLFGAVLPSHLLPDLRDVLYAQARHRLSLERGDPRPYQGPGTFARAVGARRAAWLLQQAFSLPVPGAGAVASDAAPSSFSSSATREETNALEQSGTLVLPLSLAAAEDPSPSVQRHGAAALLSLSLCGGSAAVAGAATVAASRLASAQRDLLLDASRRLVIGCEPGFARVALPAAAALTVAALLPPIAGAAAVEQSSSAFYPPSRSAALHLRLPQPRAEPLHALWREMLAEAERAGHRPPLRRAFLACACDPLLPATGAFAARHLARLAPLLMEWSALPGDRCEASRAAALAALAALARDCGGAGGAGDAAAPDHAGVLWRRALAAARDEDARVFARGLGGSGAQAAADGTRTGRAVVALARALRGSGGSGAAAAEVLAAWRVASARGGCDRCEKGAVLARVLMLLEEAAGG